MRCVDTSLETLCGTWSISTRKNFVNSFFQQFKNKLDRRPSNHPYCHSRLHRQLPAGKFSRTSSEAQAAMAPRPPRPPGQTWCKTIMPLLEIMNGSADSGKWNAYDSNVQTIGNDDLINRWVAGPPNQSSTKHHVSLIPPSLMIQALERKSAINPRQISNQKGFEPCSMKDIYSLQHTCVYVYVYTTRDPFKQSGYQLGYGIFFLE